MATSVETMGTEFALGQPDGFDQRLQRIEFQRGEPEPLADDLDQPFVLGRTGGSILLQVLVFVAFQFLDNPTGNELQRTLGGGEADVGSCINQRRTGNTHVNLFCTTFIKHFYIVTQLCSTHNRIIAK